MFLDSDGDDGVLVDPQGYDYARYSAYISNARQLCRLGQYPALDDYNRDMQSLVFSLFLLWATITNPSIKVFLTMNSSKT